jgi:glucose-6-phosphate isomerase
MNELTYTLPPDLSTAVQQVLDDWQTTGRMQRLWDRDAAVWTGSDEAHWLGWLTIAQESLDQLGELQAFARDVAASGITHVVLLGMGGSSMAPEVIRDTYGLQSGYPSLEVLDSTDPAQVRTVEAAVDLQHTLFVVASKSGSTLEPNILKAYFFQRMVDTVGAGQAAAHFVAITDPDSSLEVIASNEGFRRIFHGQPDVGGRFSALSNFGMVPAALIGVDCRRFLENTLQMVAACAADQPVAGHPGAVLGCIIGVAASVGRDKLTIIATPQLASIGAWLEQLVAESTGKQGKGIIPIDGEQPGAPAEYGGDRVFVYMSLDGTADPQQEQVMAQLEEAGQPVIRISLPDAYYLGQELFRWEMATAVAGSVLDVNPFDQPDVEASKIETRKITEACEAGESLPEETLLAGDGMLAMYTDGRNAAELRAACGDEVTVAAVIKAHMARIESGDYFALLAYLERNIANTRRLQGIRSALRGASTVATCLGFGPRFLHSTGQAYKGGPNSGVFLQLTADPVADLQVPGHKYTFGLVEAAQARGDFAVLAERGRRVLRVHLGADVAAGLERLDELMARSV